MVEKLAMPNFHEQKDNSPDDYERYYGYDYTSRTYRSLEEKEMDKKSSRFAVLVVGGFVLALSVAIYFLVT